MEAIVLAAGLGKRLRPITADRPKCLLEVNGRTLLERQVDQLSLNGVNHVWIIVGYMAHRIMNRIRPGDKVSYVYNPHYATASNVVSMRMGLDRVSDDLVYLMGDCIFEDALLSRLIARDGGDTVAVDVTDRCCDNEVRVSLREGRVVRIGKHIGDPSQGRFAGAVRICRDTVDIMRREIDRLLRTEHSNLITCDVLDAAIRRKGLAVVPTDVSDLYWDEIDDTNDWERVKGSFSYERPALGY